MKLVYMLPIILIVGVLLLGRNREGYGVFGHRSVLNGIKLNSRDFYSFKDLQQQYPINYWKHSCYAPECHCSSCQKKRYMSEFDKEEQKYHSKRFSPQVFQ